MNREEVYGWLTGGHHIDPVIAETMISQAVRDGASDTQRDVFITYAESMFNVYNGKPAARKGWQDITIRETEDGPEILFDGGVQGWPIPCTENDLRLLMRRLREREQGK